MLAGDAPALTKIKYPVFISPKLDGIRAVTTKDGLMSRRMKLIPNKHVQELSKSWPLAVDGELVMKGRWTASIGEVSSAVMSQEGKPDVDFVAFDLHRQKPFEARLSELMSVWSVVAPHILVSSPEEVDTWLRNYLRQGYEGAVLRSPRGWYKYGRSTQAEGLFLKLKMFADFEAVIVGFKEEQENNNEPDADGRRASVSENKSGKNSLGAFICKVGDVEFECGSGFTDQQRMLYWKDREKLIGRLITVKHQPPFVKEKPRFPVFKGFRDD